MFVRIQDWPLRFKMAALLVLTSLVPLIVVAIVDIREARQRMVENTATVLEARAGDLVGELDEFNRGYRRAADRLAADQDIPDYYYAGPNTREEYRHALEEIIEAEPTVDARVRGSAFLDPAGTVKVASEQGLVGTNLSHLSYVQRALGGEKVISDVHLAGPEVGFAPSIGYLTPVFGRDNRVIGVVALWIKASALWDRVKQANALAGPGSFAVIFDHQGVRIAHTGGQDTVFRPGGTLDPATVESLVAERRFGEKTADYLRDIRAVPEQFERSRAEAPDGAMFEGYSPTNRQRNYGVGRRFQTAPWTVFYMVPEAFLNAQIAEVTWKRATFAGLTIGLALLAGAVSAVFLLRPIRALSAATQAIAGGDLTARVPTGPADELGRLGDSFNDMATRIQDQAGSLSKARDELETRVQDRTADLERTTGKLEIEVAERRGTEKNLKSQLERLKLLEQITHAIGEHQDLHSIFQVVTSSLEDQLPLGFCCVCLHDKESPFVTVTSVGAHSARLSQEMGMPTKTAVRIDANALSRCVAGELVYDPDVRELPMPFPQKLASVGLRSLVVAPLQVESQVFGVLVAAREEPGGFSSADCEFLKQLTAHVALASRQAELHEALQRAYDDLKHSQEAVLQQERLRVLGQMASGIAHDINNALSPVALYTEFLLEKEVSLSASGRGYLQIIQHAIEDVAQTIARLREFYRQHEPQMTFAPVRLNVLVQQVVDLSRARWRDIPQQLGIVVEMQTSLVIDLPTVMGIESEIRDALINLIFNAVDAMPAGGVLTLRTRVTANDSNPGRSAPMRVQVEVADQGLGMSEETRSRCLEPFYTTKGERGTGLGLAMVFGVIQRHSGEIEIDSTVGKGTTVRLSFPAAPGDLVQPIQRTAPFAPSTSLRILVVDDDPLLLKSLRDTLEGDQHMVSTANGGQAAIDAFRAARDQGMPFDIVLTDLGMPNIDGRKVAGAIKTMSPSTPVILLTGWGQRLVAEGDVPPNVDRLLNKPPKIRELREALADCWQPRTIP